MAIDPIPLLTRTVDHIRAHPEGHVQMAIGQFVLVMVVTFVAVCGGVAGSVVMAGAGAALSLASDSDGLGGLFMLLMYPLMFGLMLMSLPPIILLYFGYQNASLDEIDGKEAVSIKRVFGLVAGSFGSLLALAALSCGMSFVGLMMCYVGIFFTALPFKFAHLIQHDRQVGLVEALGLSWQGFMAAPSAHAIIMVVELVLAMVLSYILLIGPAVLWPVLSVFDAMAYRELYPREPAAIGS